MNKICILAMAAWSVSFAVCADMPSGTNISPLIDMYDSVWVKGEDGGVKTLDQVADDLSQYDVVFFGEFHGHSGVHLAQMKMFSALQQRYPNMTLSLEQFERDVQPLLDQYLADEIGEKVLQEVGRGWPNYEQSYRPLVEFAKENGLPVIASEAPKEAVICISKEGPEFINEIPMPDRNWVAKEIHVEEGAYMDKYMAFLEGSSTHGPNKDEEESADSSCADLSVTSTEFYAVAEVKKMDHGAETKTSKMNHGAESSKDDSKKSHNPAASMPAADGMSDMMKAMIMKSFSSQVLRDDTMAESIAMHLQDNPDRKVLHLDGNFHSASHLGTVERLKLRMPELKIAVINPIAVENNQSPSWTDEDASTGDYILLVRETPEMFVCESREMEYHRRVIKKRMGNKCVYKEATDKNMTGKHEE